MANIDAPRGFEPYRHLGGGEIRSNAYPLASATANAIFRGDAVILSSGKVDIAADSSSTILGIFRGVEYVKSDGTVMFSPNWLANEVTLGSVDARALVYDDPMISYKVQTDTGTAYVDATHRGTAVDIEKDHSGSAVTGQSGQEIDLADTGTGQFLIRGLIDEPGNAAGVNAKVEVVVKESFLKAN